MFVKPGPHPTEKGASLKVRLCHARARFLSPDGEEVPETQDWLRSLARGDVTLVELAEKVGELGAPGEVHIEGDHPAEPATTEGAPA